MAQILLKIFLFPFILIVSLPGFIVIGFIGIYAIIYNHFLEQRLKSRMKSCGRFLRISQVHQNIHTNGGTLIIEYPAPGWRYTRAWWTPEDIFAKSPYPMSTEEEYKKTENLDLDKYCWDNYTSPENGRAFLLKVHIGRIMERKLKKTFPELRVVRAYTGTALMQAHYSKEKQ